MENRRWTTVAKASGTSDPLLVTFFNLAFTYGEGVAIVTPGFTPSKFGTG